MTVPKLPLAGVILILVGFLVAVATPPESPLKWGALAAEIIGVVLIGMFLGNGKFLNKKL